MVDRRRTIEAYTTDMEQLDGWFERLDVVVMDVVDTAQKAEGITGDILEIGCYQGKSAVLLGWFLGGDERLFVCDPFDGDQVPDGDRAEIAALYGDLSLGTFTSNFARFHDFLPTILACPSSDPAVRGLPRSFRFIHVDGSHRYENVRGDIDLSASLLRPGGIAVFDDYRYWVEVSFAVWRATALGQLQPVALTEHKLYGTFGPSTELVGRIQSALVGDAGLRTSTHRLEGFDVVQVDGFAGTVTPPP